LSRSFSLWMLMTCSILIKSNISFMHTIISGLNSRLFSIRSIIVYFLIPKTFNYHLLGSIKKSS
jgi:hypothetical protein